MKASGVRHAALSLVKGTRLAPRTRLHLCRAWLSARPADYPLPAGQLQQDPHSNPRPPAPSRQAPDVRYNPAERPGPQDPRRRDANFAKITVGHLLDHIAGIPTDVADVTVLSAFPSAKLPIHRRPAGLVDRQPDLVAAPGTAAAWGYSNNGHIFRACRASQTRQLGRRLALTVPSRIKPLGESIRRPRASTHVR
jgi:hypothetical protein